MTIGFQSDSQNLTMTRTSSHESTILPETLAGDTQRIAGLEREATLLATLNHESASTTG